MKRLHILLLSALLLFISCNKKEVDLINPTTNDDINFFIWKGLATYYLWQKEVPDLATDRFSSYDDLYSYFRQYDSPEEVFYSSLYQYRIVDKYSWIVDDYIALENSFQGVNVANGMEFGLVRYKNDNSKVFGYVRYVVPNSDATTKGIQRGMLFSKVDGQQITENNFSTLLFGNLNYTIELANYNDGNPVENGTLISLTKSELSENPVKIAKVFEESSTKIGYLMYNQFARNYDGQLNAVFANFKSQNINELIVDLRYNPGGSTSSANYLASMITGQFTNQIFSREQWNDRVMNSPNASPDNFISNFRTEIRNVDSDGNVVLQENFNSLNLNKVYFIVTGSSASASELVINSLRPYIDVRVIGLTTEGKQVGSITLYDSDNLYTKQNINSKHRYAMQPIVLEIKNKDSQNYPDGIVPGITSPGILLGEDYSNLGVLGDRNEPLLSRTIQYILTGAKGVSKPKSDFSQEIYHSKLATPASNNMIVDMKELSLHSNF